MANKHQPEVHIRQVETGLSISTRNTDEAFLPISEVAQTDFYCYKRHFGGLGDTTRPHHGSLRRCDRDGTLRLLEELRQPLTPTSIGKDQTVHKDSYQACFTLMFVTCADTQRQVLTDKSAAHGCGYAAREPFSLEQSHFDLIAQDLQLPPAAEEVYESIHGVFAKFGEETDDGGLFIIFSTSKSPMRQIFLAMKVQVVQNKFSLTCLLLDGRRDDLLRVSNHIVASVAELDDLDWRQPLSLLTKLLQDIGYSSEGQRRKLDLDIMWVEEETNTCVPPLVDQSKLYSAKVKWPDDSHASMSRLHKCHNKLVFAARAVDEEVDAWNQLRDMIKDRAARATADTFDEDPGARLRIQDKPGKKQLRSSADSKIGKTVTKMLETIDFEMAHTKSRKTQIQGLKERVTVQIDLIHNLMTYQEASQTSMIAIVALIFAPASLIASIFSAGLFSTDDRSWTTYVASTVPITLAIFVLGLQFTKLQPKITQGWKAAARFLRPSRHQQEQVPKAKVVEEA